MAVSWIKLRVDMFEDEKIDYLASLPEADGLILIWIRLLTMAGRSNACGYVMLTESIAYTDEMLAHKFKKPITTVKMALELFHRLGMIGIDGDGIRLINFAKHQSHGKLEELQVREEARKEQNRLRQERYRERSKLQMLPSPENGGCVTDIVTEGENEKTTPIEPSEEKQGIAASNVTSDATDNALYNGEITHFVSNENKNKSKEKEGTYVPTDAGTPDQPPKSKYKYDEPQMQLAELLRDKILEVNPGTKIPENLDTWANTIRLMVERDKREVDHIKAAIVWCSKENFWSSVTLSADALRRNYDKMLAQARKEKKVQKSTRMDGAIAGTKTFLEKFGGATNGDSGEDCRTGVEGGNQLQQEPDRGGNIPAKRDMVSKFLKNIG